MKNVFRRVFGLIAVLIIFILEFGSFSTIFLSAAWETEEYKEENYIPTPSINVKAMNDTDVIVTIEPLDFEIDGYEVWIDSDIGYEEYKIENTARYYCYNADLTVYDYFGDESGDYYLADIVATDGLETKEFTIKSLPIGEIMIKVRACLGDIRSKCSEPKTIVINSGNVGYKQKYNFSKVKVGDTIKFGSFEKDFPIDGRDPIEWIVLEKKKDRIFVISKYIIDTLPYNIDLKDVSWETCTLRRWLNEEFYRVAFNSKEKKLIKASTVKNPSNRSFGTDGGKETKDKVFILSEREVLDEKYGFSSWEYTYDINRRCAPTDYAVAQGISKIYKSDYQTKENLNSFSWWLRTPGFDSTQVSIIKNDGGLFNPGDDVNSWMNGVRPVMWIKNESKKTKK